MKRKQTAGSSSAGVVIDQMGIELTELSERLHDLLDPSLPKGGFMLTDPGSHTAVIEYLWRCDFSDSEAEILEANPDLDTYLRGRTANSRGFSSAQVHEDNRAARLNFTAGLISRDRHQSFLPKSQLLLAMEARHKMLNKELWQSFSAMRCLPSYTWTAGIMQEALKRADAATCPYSILDYVSAAVFDNYTEHFNYSARHNADSQGERIDMTNWATLYLPLSSAPDTNLAAMAAPGTDAPLSMTFKPSFDKFSVAELCHPLHPDIVSNQHRRWCESFRALRAGTYFHRPSFQPAHAHHLWYQRPFEGLLQSSYADVEEEVDGMRENPKHKHSWWVFIGGDGLAINRVNHTLARHPGKYLRQRPVVIPVQGEHPHGTCHILHMGWRPFSPLVVGLLKDIGHAECKADFTVSSFNDYDHSMCILIEGIAKYFMHLSDHGGPPPLGDSGAFLAACSINVDLEWLAHFLHDFGFLYWDTRQAVRGNDSARIDLSWWECVSFMHTIESNKTQYAPMAILRVFWSEALHPNLARIYHYNRTISLLGLKGSNCGWDMPIEKENLAISSNVVRPTFERVCAYVAELNLLGPVIRAIQKILFKHRQVQPGKMKKISEDVNLIVEKLKKVLGATWAEACVPRPQKDSKLINPPKSPMPWKSVMKSVEDGTFIDWVKGHLRTKISWM